MGKNVVSLNWLVVVLLQCQKWFLTYIQNISSAIGVGGTTLSALGSRAPAGNGGLSGGSGGGGEEKNNHDGWGMSNPLDTL